MSTHSCDVIEVKLETHPNADSLSVVRIYGWQCVVRTDDWKNGDLGVYIPPDSVVKTNRPEFAFLMTDESNTERIKVKKLRGFISQGLLIHAPEGAKVGDDYMEYFEVQHYEPPLPLSSGGDNEIPPEGYYPKYDVENFNKYPRAIEPGEVVVVTEKLHGANARFKWHDGRLRCGSRANWKKYNPLNIWWRASEQNPWIAEWCKNHPELTLYGEVFGKVQSLQYGAGQNDIFCRIFDVWDNVENKWLDYKPAMEYAQHPNYPGQHPRLKWVPVLYVGPFDEDSAREFAEGDSSIADHHREGVVIKPAVERRDDAVGRVILKIVGNRYLSKS